MDILFLWLALAAAAVESLLLAISMLRPDFEFWPPPSSRSWQKRVFFGLFRIFCGATILVAGNIPGRTTTLSLAIYQLVQLGQDGAAYRLMALTVAIAFAAVWASEWFLRRGSRT